MWTPEIFKMATVIQWTFEKYFIVNILYLLRWTYPQHRQLMLILVEYLSSPRGFSGVHVPRYSAFCVMLCRSYLSFCVSLCLLFFGLRHLITLLVFSDFSYQICAVYYMFISHFMILIINLLSIWICTIRSFVYIWPTLLFTISKTILCLIDPWARN